MLRNFQANRQLTNRIEILSNADRDRLNRGVEAASDADKPKLLATLGRVLKYNRSGADTDRAALPAEDVRALFEAKTKDIIPKTGKAISIERAGVDAILDGDDEELEQLGQKLRETIRNFEENETPTVTLDLTNRGEQATTKIPPPLVRMLKRTVTPSVLGGKFTFPNADTFAAALDDLDSAVFSPFSTDGEKSCQTLLNA